MFQIFYGIFILYPFNFITKRVFQFSETKKPLQMQELQLYRCFKKTSILLLILLRMLSVTFLVYRQEPVRSL